MRQTKEITSWGRYSKTQARVWDLHSSETLSRELKTRSFITRGRGLSYGDCSLNSNILETTDIHHCLSFDSTSGLMTCESGITLKEILQIAIPEGWMLPVTPGTSEVTLGGAIACDIHGKNHLHKGTFGQWIHSMDLLLGSGERVNISTSHMPDLFRATCGGMGLTGIILNATIQLMPLASSQFKVTQHSFTNLQDLLEGFEHHKNSPYLVAWLDHNDRSVISVAENVASELLDFSTGVKLRIPLEMPDYLMNPHFIKAFNYIYRHTRESGVRHLQSFLFPLDRIQNWNLLYGKSGMIQYQFVIPKAAALEAMSKIRQKLRDQKVMSYLNVLKVMGQANSHHLSFPIEGYCLAMDFKATPETLQVLDILDQIVLSYQGRIYLSKDARMSESTFKKSYPLWEEFEIIRSKYQAAEHFSSQQSKRLGLV